MQEDELKYHEKSQESLEFIYKSIDRERFPDRFQMLVDEINKRKRLGKWDYPKAKSDNQNIKRAIAFLIDTLVIGLLADLVLNLVTLPSLVPLTSRLSVFIFVGYFYFFENKSGGASLGKKVFNLKVFYHQDQFNHIMMRVLFVWVIIPGNLYSFISPDNGLPQILNSLLLGLPLGISILNLIFMLRNKDAILLQDNATLSHVGFEKKENITQQKLTIKPLIPVAIIVLVGTYFLLPQSNPVLNSQEQKIKEVIARESGHWSQVDISELKSLTGSDSTYKLELKIRVPMTKFNDIKNNDELSQKILRQVKLTNTNIISGSFIIYASISYFYLNFTRTLNFGPVQN